jgi:hypothetical protein
MNGSLDHRSMDIVEDALRTYPLAPVPASLKIRVMNGVRPASSFPRFTFPWLEAAISLMCSTLLTAVVTLLLKIPPPAAVRLENSVRLLLLQPGSRSIVLAAPFSVILAALCLALAVRLFRRPFAAQGLSHR